LGARIDHTNLSSNCFSCHNVTTAPGKLQDHILSTNSCESCHASTSWKPATRVDHSQVNGSCSSCHNGTTATGKPGGHFISSQQCDTCHNSTSNWGSTSFTHGAGNYPGDHRGNPGCLACHTSNNEVIPWPSPAYQPTCAACHANDYRSNKHENLPVSSVKDCAGSCHKPNPQHSVRHSSWDN